VRARAEAASGDPRLAVEAWQRAWELGPAGAAALVDEAWSWAADGAGEGDGAGGEGRLALLIDAMLASLRASEDPWLTVALADKVARRHPDQAADALDRVAARSATAQLALVRLRLSRGQRELASEEAMRPLAAPGVACGRCGLAHATYLFRCPRCGAWDTAVVAREPALVDGERGISGTTTGGASGGAGGASSGPARGPWRGAPEATWTAALAPDDARPPRP